MWNPPKVVPSVKYGADPAAKPSVNPHFIGTVTPDMSNWKNAPRNQPGQYEGNAQKTDLSRRKLAKLP